MKVFTKMDGNDTEMQDTFQYCFLQKAKYKLMWHLRFLEKEINESGGTIILDMKTIDSKIDFRFIGMNENLINKIIQVASSVQL